MHVQLKAATGRWFASHFKIRSPPLFSVCLFDSLPEWFFSFFLFLSRSFNPRYTIVFVSSYTVSNCVSEWLVEWMQSMDQNEWMMDKGMRVQLPRTIAWVNAMDENVEWMAIRMNEWPNEWMDGHHSENEKRKRQREDQMIFNICTHGLELVTSMKAWAYHCDWWVCDWC